MILALLRFVVELGLFPRLHALDSVEGWRMESDVQHLYVCGRQGEDSPLVKCGSMGTVVSRPSVPVRHVCVRRVCVRHGEG